MVSDFQLGVGNRGQTSLRISLRQIGEEASGICCEDLKENDELNFQTWLQNLAEIFDWFPELTRMNDEGSLAFDPSRLLRVFPISDLTHAPEVVIAEEWQDIHSAYSKDGFDDAIFIRDWEAFVGNWSAVAFPGDFVGVLKDALKIDRLLRLQEVVLLLWDEYELRIGSRDWKNCYLKEKKR